MTINDYKRTSIEFRRIASNMLCSDYTVGNLHVIRFYNYITGNKIIRALIDEKIKNTAIDYEKEFVITNGSLLEFSIPIDEDKHIKAMLDYLAVLSEKEIDLRNTAFRLHCSSNLWKDIVDNFLEKAFKPLVDFIADSLSKEIMCLEEENRKWMTQYIGTVYGTVNQAGESINSINTTNVNDIQIISQLIQKVKPSIKEADVPDSEKDDVIDDLDIISEQLASPNPKQSRLKKALDGIKKFVFTVGAESAALVITQTDWTELITRIEAFVRTLG